LEPPDKTQKVPHRPRLRAGLRYMGISQLTGGGVLASCAKFIKIPGDEPVASRLRRSSAVYVKMSDGTPIAVDIWLPEEMQEG
jgi:predicted acyl esterase